MPSLTVEKARSAGLKPDERRTDLGLGGGRDRGGARYAAGAYTFACRRGGLHGSLRRAEKQGGS